MKTEVRAYGLAASLQGNMPALLSHYRPDFNIYMFTDDPAVQRRMAMYHGVTPLSIKFGTSADETFDRCVHAWGAACHLSKVPVKACPASPAALQSLKPCHSLQCARLCPSTRDTCL